MATFGRKIIAFNGPPRSGKDTLANLLKTHLESNYYQHKVERVALSLPMRISACACLGQEYTEDWYESNKDVVHPLIGTTFRQFMIDLSERHIKPMYGHAFWTRSAIVSIKPKTHIVIISDLGFQSEIDYLNQLYGPDNVLVVQTDRVGSTWKGDSREPLSSQLNFPIFNDKKPADAVVPLRKFVGELWNLQYASI